MSGYTHQPVLLQPTIDALNIKPNGIYIDATFGRGGHSKAILDKLGPEGRLIAIDRDPTANAAAKEKFGHDKRFEIHHSSFGAIAEIAKACGVYGKVAGILLDLGLSSPQLDDPERGFSFLREGPLDMRMDPSQGISAAEWIAKAKASEMATIFKEYGEERFAKRIAGAIVEQREIEPITTTARLAGIVSEANPKWEKHKHPATRVFQAIRIFINEELSTLSNTLEQCVDVLAKEGRLAVISFHSLEDRIVKRFLRKQAKGELPKGLPVTVDQIQASMQLIGKAVVPTEVEVSENPRARSAVLRIGEKLK